MLKRAFYFCLIISACFTLSACDLDWLFNQADISKFNAYVGLNNFLINDMETALTDYFENLGDKTEPYIQKNFNFVPDTFSKYEVATVKEAYEFSKKKPEYQAIDSTMLNLYPKLNELMNLMQEAHTYYKLNNYRDDQFTKAKELHKKIITCTKEYYPLANQIINDIQVLGDERTIKELASLKKKGKLMRYYCKSILIHAQTLQAELINQKIDSSNLLKLELSKFKEIYNLLVVDVEQLLEYSKNETKVELEGFPIKSAYYSSFLSDVVNIKVSATEIIDRVERQKAPSRFEINNPEISKGTPEKLEKAINDAIYDYNKMN